MISRRIIGLVVILPGLICAAVGSRADDSIRFNRDIRPILSSACFDCHGFDAKQRKAELRLDIPEAATAERDGSPAIVPGAPDDSELWKRISSADPEVVMPPPDSKKSLTPDQRELLREWIRQGAPYQKHWAFETPVPVTPPAVRQATWVRNPIDQFILAHLESHNLTPRPEADRETLIRRVAFTLTGLPPTIAEVDQFLSDTSDTAYDSMVRRFLNAPGFGEEQARHWLDVARYADTHGLHLDNERQMWAYRDWVVRAFNDNLPFDQFTTWQLAGDLLPDPSLDQLVATGFNRCNVTTSEGGAIVDEWLYRYAVDRTSTTMQTWMGLTAGCAVCHDHKYDPVTQHDFYSMYAFFYSAADPAMDGNINTTSPFIQVPSVEQRDALQRSRDREASLRQKLDAALASLGEADPVPNTTVTGAGVPLTETYAVDDVVIGDDFPAGATSRNTTRNAVSWVLDPAFGARAGRRVLELAFGAHFEVNVELKLVPVIVPEDGSVTCWVRTDPFHQPDYFSVRMTDAQGSKRAVWTNDAELSGPDGLQMGSLPRPGEWLQLSVSLSQLGMKPGSRILSLQLVQHGGRLWLDDLRVAGRIQPTVDPLSSFSAWWALNKGENPPDVPSELAAVLTAGPADSVPAETRGSLQRYYQYRIQRIPASPVPELLSDLRAAELEVAAIKGEIPGTFSFRDLEQPRDAFVMIRGQYDKPGEQVQPGVPPVFAPLRTDAGEPVPATQRATRLDLARWLLADENPLTARVTVNRFWQQVFGTGLVRTSDDFGTRGELPSHPELLDWLGAHYRDLGWDTKELYFVMLTSASFRQHSATTDEQRQRDPENRLLGRGPRLRLDAEQLRDNVLFVSGLMNPQIGGRGVLPYQPPGIWEPVGYQDSNTRFYLQDHGAALYRRSLYCFLKRTAPPPFMSNFDGPNREQFCTRRERSNTPLQALQLMNDVQHFEAARALAERTLAEAGPSASQRISFLYRTVLARLPDADEQWLLEQSLNVQLGLFSADPDAARKAVHIGESTPRGISVDSETAAWTMIANLILNLDETICRN